MNLISGGTFDQRASRAVRCGYPPALLTSAASLPGRGGVILVPFDWKVPARVDPGLFVIQEGTPKPLEIGGHVAEFASRVVLLSESPPRPVMLGNGATMTACRRVVEQIHH